MKSILSAALILLSVYAFAQQTVNKDKWKLCLDFPNASIAYMADLGTTLVSDPEYKGYGFYQNKYKFSNFNFTIGTQYEGELTKSWMLVAWQPEMTLSLSSNNFFSKDTVTMNRRDLEYYDVKGLQYKINYNYDYLVLNPFSGRFGYKSGDNRGDFTAFFELSLPYYINLNKSNLSYWSNVKRNQEEDLQVQSELKKYLKGRNYFAFNAGIGATYRVWEHVALSFRASHTMGLSDALETLANGHGFIDNPNQRKSFNASFGVFIDL